MNRDRKKKEFSREIFTLLERLSKLDPKREGIIYTNLIYDEESEIFPRPDIQMMQALWKLEEYGFIRGTSHYIDITDQGVRALEERRFYAD